MQKIKKTKSYFELVLPSNSIFSNFFLETDLTNRMKLFLEKKPIDNLLLTTNDATNSAILFNPTKPGKYQILPIMALRDSSFTVGIDVGNTNIYHEKEYQRIKEELVNKSKEEGFDTDKANYAGLYLSRNSIVDLAKYIGITIDS